MKRAWRMAILVALILCQGACEPAAPPEKQPTTNQEHSFPHPKPEETQSIVRTETRGDAVCSKACDSTHRNPEPALAPPRIALDMEEVQFGDVFPDREPEKIVRVTNTGKGPLRIESVKATCPCIHPELSPNEIPAGSAGDLTIKLALADYPKNFVKGSVHLHTNDPSRQSVQIPVHADIHPEYVVEPETLDFGTVKRAHTHTATLTLRQNGPHEAMLREVQAPPELTVTWEKALDPTDHEQPATSHQPLATCNNTRERGSSNSKPETRNPKPGYLIRVQYTPPPNAHILNTKLTLITNIPRIPTHTVRVRAKAIGIECSVTPKVVVFGPDAPGADIGVLDIAPTGSTETLELLDATCSVADIELRPETTESGKRHRIHLRLKDTATPGEKAGSIALTLKEGPLAETRDVTLYGTVK